jgi:tRNA(fMet)-specific endonuclease VapC
MRFLLDTNTCIYLIKKKPPQVLRKFNAFVVGAIGISSITTAELWFGVQKSRYPGKNQRALEQFLIPLTVVEFDHQAAMAYGRIRAWLESQGTPIGPLDTLISAQALSMQVTLVTNNIREFSRVPELKLENWAED